MPIEKKNVSFAALRQNYGGNFDGFALSDKTGRIIGFDMPQGTSVHTVTQEVLLFMENCPFAVTVNRRAGTFLDAILLDPSMQSGTAICLDRSQGWFLFFNSQRAQSVDTKLIQQIEKWTNDGILIRLLMENGEKK